MADRSPDAGTAARVREGVPAGSLRHLATLFSGSPDRPLLEAIYAYEAELRRIVCASSHEAAHARLQWWRHELDRLGGGRPSHPLAEALLPLRERPYADLGLLHEMVVAADLDLARLTYLSWQELDGYLFRAGGAAQTLIATVLAGSRGPAAAEREFARRLGAYVRQTEILATLEVEGRRGRVYAPLRALESAGLDPAAFASGAKNDARHAFVTGWRAQVREELESLSGALPERQQRAAQRHGLVLAALHARWLRRAAPAQEPDPAVRGEPGPFARLWTAWRVAMRHH